MKRILPGLFLIDLDLPVTGFRQFISSWLLQKNGLTFLVDPGPASTVPRLLDEMRRLNIRSIDYILLTHIHIDHAGGAGLVLKEFPETRVLCHPKGIPHLIDPGKLWQGSQKVLGNLAIAYGPIASVPEDKLFFTDKITLPGFEITVIETPGHALHHVSYLLEDLLFVGEAAGTRLQLERGEYMRPATPPRFFYEIYRHSIEKLIPLHMQHLCFAHYGHRTEANDFLKQALKQLDLWMEILRTYLRQGVVDEDSLMKRLLEQDVRLKLFSELAPDIQERERYFLRNSIRGIKEYLTEELQEKG